MKYYVQTICQFDHIVMLAYVRQEVTFKSSGNYVPLMTALALQRKYSKTGKWVV